jgi:hypothetical protein
MINDKKHYIIEIFFQNILTIIYNFKNVIEIHNSFI